MLSHEFRCILVEELLEYTYPGDKLPDPKLKKLYARQCGGRMGNVSGGGMGVCWLSLNGWERWW